MGKLKTVTKFLQRLLWIPIAWVIVVFSLVVTIIVEVVLAVLLVIGLPVVMFMDVLYKTPWEVLDVYKAKRSEEVRQKQG